MHTIIQKAVSYHMARPKQNVVTLTVDEVSALQKVVRTHTAEARTVQRAKILLYSFDGMSDTAIAEKLDINRRSVYNCISKFLAAGVDAALADFARPGRSGAITDAEKAWIIDIACQKPEICGYDQELWTISKLQYYVQSTCEAAGYPGLKTISLSKVWAILNDNEIKLQKTKYYIDRVNLGLSEKLNSALIIYKPLDIQYEIEEEASECTQPETVSLLAGMDLYSGEIIPVVRDTHAGSDFVDFLKELDEKYECDLKIRIVLDNHSSHTLSETMTYLASRPGRFEFVFAPQHGSWLNLIEGFFGKMARAFFKSLKVSSKDELINQIYQYMDEVNSVPVVYHWKYEMDEMIV